MKDNYDFSKGVKNPYVDKLKKGYTVMIHYDLTQNTKSRDEEIENELLNKHQLQKKA